MLQNLFRPTGPIAQFARNAVLGADPPFDDLYEIDGSKSVGTGKFSEVFVCIGFYLTQGGDTQAGRPLEALLSAVSRLIFASILNTSINLQHLPNL